VLEKSKIIKAITYSAFAAVLLPSQMANAGSCSPGIPCTGYDIYNQPNANTSSAYNGNKDGTGTTACDGNFMNQIYARAFLEAQREVMLSEQIIHKPDSVLEYTCFDQYVGLAANYIDPLFSARQNWDDRVIPLWGDDNNTNVDHDGDGDPDTVTINNDDVTYLSDQTDYSVFENDRYDNILEELLMDSMEEYIDENYDHTFMGESITLDNNMNLSSLSATGSYSCAHMLAVWDIARCIDFGEDDRFRSFNTLASGDIRSIPQACSTPVASDVVESGTASTKLDNTSSGVDIGASLGVSVPGITLPIPSIPFTSGGLITRMPSDGPKDDCPPAGGATGGLNTDITNDLIRLSNNCDDGSDLNPFSSTDIMEIYDYIVKGFGVVIPGTGSPSVPSKTGVVCSSPIPTGLPVLTYMHTSGFDGNGLPIVNRDTFIHYDHICPNPGCYYQPVKIPYNPAFPVPSASAVTIGTCLPSF